MGIFLLNGSMEFPDQKKLTKIIGVKDDSSAATILLKFFSKYQEITETSREKRNSSELIIFVDIDDTLIRGSTDFISAYQGNYSGIEVISPQIIQTLRMIKHCAQDQQLNVTILGLTSASLWRIIQHHSRPFFSLTSPIFDYPVLIPETTTSSPSEKDKPSPKKQIINYSILRSQAMESIGVPFSIDTPHPQPLSFIKSHLRKTFNLTSRKDLQVSEPLTFSFPSSSNPAPYFLEENISFYKVRKDDSFRFLVKEIFQEGEIFSEIKGFPVLHRGIISMNCINPPDGLNKGAAVESYLFSHFGEIQNLQKDLYVIAIDDNVTMLESICHTCCDLQIPCNCLKVFAIEDFEEEF